MTKFYFVMKHTTLTYIQCLYHVDFRIIDKKSDTIHLGHGSFSDQTWRNGLKLSRIGNFYLLPVKENSYLKLLLTTFDNRKKVDTMMSPQKSTI